MAREHNATAGIVCPADVKAAFNLEFDDIDIDVPLGELLVEASKDTPRCRGCRVNRTASPRRPVTPGRIQTSSEYNNRTLWPVL